jgi:hypothetical protein
VDHFPEGHFPDGHFPEGHFPQYVTPTHTVFGLLASVRSVGRKVVSRTFSFIAGNSVMLEFTVTNEAGQAVDITGDTIRFVVARGGEVAISTEDGNASIDTSQTASGKFFVTVSDEDTAALKGTYLYQAEIEDTAGNKATVAKGPVTFSANLLATAS